MDLVLLIKVRRLFLWFHESAFLHNSSSIYLAVSCQKIVFTLLSSLDVEVNPGSNMPLTSPNHFLKQNIYIILAQHSVAVKLQNITALNDIGSCSHPPDLIALQDTTQPGYLFLLLTFILSAQLLPA